MNELVNLNECSITNQIINEDITNNSKEFKYSMPTIISEAQQYDIYLPAFCSSEDEFKSIEIDGGELSEDYSYIKIPNNKKDGTVKLTINGGIFDGTIYTINYINNEEKKDNEVNKNENKKTEANTEQTNENKKDDKKTEENVVQKNEKGKIQKNQNNVKTADHIEIYFVMSLLSIIAFIGILLKIKPIKNTEK